jgi:hypothetical protein
MKNFKEKETTLTLVSRSFGLSACLRDAEIARFCSQREPISDDIYCVVVMVRIPKPKVSEVVESCLLAICGTIKVLKFGLT